MNRKQSYLNKKAILLLGLPNWYEQKICKIHIYPNETILAYNKSLKISFIALYILREENLLEHNLLTMPQNYTRAKDLCCKRNVAFLANYCLPFYLRLNKPQDVPYETNDTKLKSD